jgi:hypothetical protein
MARGRRLPITPEERVARKIGKELSDFSLDLEAIGKYLGTAQPYTIYVRAVEVLEAAQYNREIAKYNDKFKEYESDTLF